MDETIATPGLKIVSSASHMSSETAEFIERAFQSPSHKQVGNGPSLQDDCVICGPFLVCHFLFCNRLAFPGASPREDVSSSAPQPRSLRFVFEGGIEHQAPAGSVWGGALLSTPGANIGVGHGSCGRHRQVWWQNCMY